jgi:hypothetical protein
MPQMPFFTGRPDPNKPVQWTPEEEQTPHPLGDAMLNVSGALRGLAGLGDDSKASRFGELVGAAAPVLKGLGMAAPLISIFKDAEGVPSSALRQASTQTFKDMAASLPYRMRGAAEQFAQDYPRVAAHMRPEYGLPPSESSKAAAYINTPPGKVLEPMKTGFTHIGRHFSENPTDYETGLNEARKMMYHEGTHAAQALGNRDFNDLYANANALVGYDLNPFERTAERAGFRAAGNTLTKTNKTAIDMLKDIAALPNQNGPGTAGGRISNIIEARDQTPMRLAVASGGKGGK